MPLEMVEMHHPEIGATVKVSRKAFDVAWQHRGWQLVSEGEVTVDAPQTQEDTGSQGELDTFDVDSMSNDE